MLEVVLNDRLGKKVRVKCNDDDTIGDLKKLVAAQTGTRAEKIRIQKWLIEVDSLVELQCGVVWQGIVEDEAAPSLFVIPYSLRLA
ncbi:hypothetical protein DKX38_012255 [Salix brachista]|uniref:Ubiquitin-like domain-containing protein n=1 Tax=Salix brachista TaxID=2182728 RepID=A0A5N5LN43_9ROSI|nr:hypothetical protein DKX38_012255 [Salix brachista]